jgi:hydroxyacylglutathione hydrolase
MLWTILNILITLFLSIIIIALLVPNNSRNIPLSSQLLANPFNLIKSSLFNLGYRLYNSKLIGYHFIHKRLMSSNSTVNTKTFPIFDYSTFTVQPVALLEDNYSYLLVEKSTNSAALVDPAEPAKILSALKQRPELKVELILTTHKHWDHSGGNEELKALYGERVTVIGGINDKPPATDRYVKAGDTIVLGKNVSISVYDAPCHTRGHVLYHINHSNSSILFTGDTLFLSGCGKFFEGSAAEMYKNLNQTIFGLGDSTAIFCGHEYSVSNLEFAEWVEPSNSAVKAKLQWAKEQRKKDLPTIGSTVAEEKSYNPFIRAGSSKEIIQRVKPWLTGPEDDPIAVLAAVRKAKDENAHKKV